MKARITNTSPANQGVWTDEGLVHLGPGQTRTLTIRTDHVERTMRSPVLKVSDPLDHDHNGEKGGAAQAAGDAATAEEITAAIAELDGKNDDHWTAAGLPKVEIVADLTGKTVTRAAIEEAAPDAKRPAE